MLIFTFSFALFFSASSSLGSSGIVRIPFQIPLSVIYLNIAFVYASASIGGAEGVPLIVKAAGRLFPNGALSHLQLYRLSKEENIGFNVADRPGLVGFLGASHGNSKYHSLVRLCGSEHLETHSNFIFRI